MKKVESMVGKRGPDKAPRKKTQTNQGRKRYEDLGLKKGSTRSVYLYDWENDFLVEKYEKLGNAVRKLIPNTEKKKHQ